MCEASCNVPECLGFTMVVHKTVPFHQDMIIKHNFVDIMVYVHEVMLGKAL